MFCVGFRLTYLHLIVAKGQVEVMHIAICKCFVKCDRVGKHYNCHHIKIISSFLNVIFTFDLGPFKEQVKVIFTFDLCPFKEQVKVIFRLRIYCSWGLIWRASLCQDIKSCMGFQLEYLHSTLDDYKYQCQGQDHAHIGCKYLVKRWQLGLTCNRHKYSFI